MAKTFAVRPLTFLLLACALFAIYLITHPYRGIHSDALIYVTRAWAPPAIVEGDMLFAHEQQTGLTLFGLLLRGFLSILPVADAARALALSGVALWFGALVCFASALARAANLARGAALAMCALVTLAPLGYSAGSSFMAGETLAVPRPFAEAFVLLAFAAMLDGRRVAGALALVAAMAFHPLMGLAGASVAFVWGAFSDRRLWLAAVAASVALVGAALAGAPFASGLFTIFDADWLALLRLRTSYLFLSQSPAAFWTDVLLRGAILVIAARHCEGRLRAFLAAALAASAVGIALSLVFADLWPSVLITQLQPWRVLFVAAILAPAAVMIIARAGEAVRITLPLIACAFMARDAAMISAAFSIGALAMDWNREVSKAASPLIQKALWAVAAALWVGFDVIDLIAFGRMLSEAPRDLDLPWSYFWGLRPLALPLGALVVFCAMRARPVRAPLAAVLALVACAAAVWRFDDRAAVDRALEEHQAPEFAQMLPSQPSSVLWLGQGKEPWYWLDRPNWLAPVQASSIVFSHDLARLWNERARFLIDVKALAPEVLSNEAAALQPFPASAAASVCARADAPAAILAPLIAGEAMPANARRIAAPTPSFQLRTGEDVRFDKIESYAVWTCRPERTF